MATPKQTKVPANDAKASPDAKTSTGARTNRGDNDRFIRAFGDDGKPTPMPKVPPQVKVIVEGVEKAGKKGLLRNESVSNITGTLLTRQPVGRIISYYEKKMTELGLVRIERSVVPAVVAAAA